MLLQCYELIIELDSLFRNTVSLSIMHCHRPPVPGCLSSSLVDLCPELTLHRGIHAVSDVESQLFKQINHVGGLNYELGGAFFDVRRNQLGGAGCDSPLFDQTKCDLFGVNWSDSLCC